MGEGVDPRLQNLLCRTFGERYRPKITLATRMEDIETWDSLTFIDLILSIEQEYGFEITPDVAVELVNVAAIQKAIQGKPVQSH